MGQCQVRTVRFYVARQEFNQVLRQFDNAGPVFIGQFLLNRQFRPVPVFEIVENRAVFRSDELIEILIEVLRREIAYLRGIFATFEEEETPARNGNES